MPGFRSPYILGGRAVHVSRRPAMMSPPGYTHRFVCQEWNFSTSFHSVLGDEGKAVWGGCGPQSRGRSSSVASTGVGGGGGGRAAPTAPLSHHHITHHLITSSGTILRPSALDGGWEWRDGAGKRCAQPVGLKIGKWQKTEQSPGMLKEAESGGSPGNQVPLLGLLRLLCLPSCRSASQDLSE